MSRWKNDDMTPLGQIRLNAGFSREYAASLLNVVMLTLYRYEHGITDIPLGIAESMASLYGVSFDTLREAARTTKEAKGSNAQGRLNKKRGRPIKTSVNHATDATEATVND